MIHHQLVTAATGQHGLLTRSQLEAELSSATISAWQRNKRLQRVGRGVYHLTALAFTYESAALAATLGTASPTWVSRRAAAALHGVIKPTVTGYQVGPLIEVTRPLGCSSRPVANETVHRSLVLPSHHCTVIERITVTTVPRTLVDLGAVTGRKVLRRWVEQALRRGSCTLALLEAVARELAKERPGAPMVRSLLADVRRSEGAEGTDLSTLARPLFRRSGLEPRWEVEVSGPSGFIGRVDALFEAQRVVAEFDSSRWHDDMDDARRDDELIDAGYLVVRASKFDLTVRSKAFVAELRALLATRTVTAVA